MEQFIEGVCERLGLERLDRNVFLQKKLEKVGIKPSHIAITLIFFYVFHLLTEHGTKWLSSTLGFFYPAYITAKLVKVQSDESGEEGRFWLKYWVVYGLLYVTEILFISILALIPHYYTLKLFLVIWLFHPDSQRASIIYGKLVRVVLQKYEHKIDAKLIRIRSFGSERFIKDTVQTIVKKTVKTAISV